MQIAWKFSCILLFNKWATIDSLLVVDLRQFLKTSCIVCVLISNSHFFLIFRTHDILYSFWSTIILSEWRINKNYWVCHAIPNIVKPLLKIINKLCKNYPAFDYNHQIVCNNDQVKSPCIISVLKPLINFSLSLIILEWFFFSSERIKKNFKGLFYPFFQFVK